MKIKLYACMAGFRPLPCAKDTGKSCAWQGRWSQMNTELDRDGCSHWQETELEWDEYA